MIAGGQRPRCEPPALKHCIQHRRFSSRHNPSSNTSRWCGQVKKPLTPPGVGEWGGWLQKYARVLQSWPRAQMCGARAHTLSRLHTCLRHSRARPHLHMPTTCHSIWLISEPLCRNAVACVQVQRHANTQAGQAPCHESSAPQTDQGLTWHTCSTTTVPLRHHQKLWSQNFTLPPQPSSPQGPKGSREARKPPRGLHHHSQNMTKHAADAVPRPHAPMTPHSGGSTPPKQLHAAGQPHSAHFSQPSAGGPLSGSC